VQHCCRDSSPSNCSKATSRKNGSYRRQFVHPRVELAEIPLPRHEILDLAVTFPRLVYAIDSGVNASWKLGGRSRGAEGAEGVGMERGYPLPIRLGGLGERRKLPQWGSGRSPFGAKPLRLRNDLYCVEWGVKLYSLTRGEAPKIFRFVGIFSPTIHQKASK